MTGAELIAELRSLSESEMPLPGKGRTAERHMRLMEIGRRDLSLARLAEAHFDAVAILAEAGRGAVRGATYGVWASEIPGKALELAKAPGGYLVNGTKMFCSGAGLIDRALVTVTQPEHRLVEVDLRGQADTITVDATEWKTPAFREIQTATVTFHGTRISGEDLIGEVGWYLDRPGFWHGACGPASCWAGGAEGLVEYAVEQGRKDPHTKAHVAAMAADVWAMQSYLATAGIEIDSDPGNKVRAGMRALMVRHLVEQGCSDVLRRFGRAYGPYPLAMKQETSQRYLELDLYLRQSHAERDLEALGTLVLEDA
jgi:alkylation response protein AidB-like acyl-CoA dehydrogenase